LKPFNPEDAMGRLRSLADVYPGVEREDEMVAAFDYCLHGRGGAAPSIDTAMYGLVEAAHVDHLHPDSGIALAAAADGPALTKECFGDRVAWVGWRRPGFQPRRAASRRRAGPGPAADLDQRAERHRRHRADAGGRRARAEDPARHRRHGVNEGGEPVNAVLEREDIDLLALFAEGLPLDIIARRLELSDRTVRRRMRSICDRLGLATPIQAVVWAARRGLV
jgi:DNA-binding CsgD family transcriptional regulator